MRNASESNLILKDIDSLRPCLRLLGLLSLVFFEMALFYKTVASAPLASQ
jgi:hypothetical protein